MYPSLEMLNVKMRHVNLTLNICTQFQEYDQMRSCIDMLSLSSLCIKDHQLIITMFCKRFSRLINGKCYRLIVLFVSGLDTRASLTLVTVHQIIKKKQLCILFLFSSVVHKSSANTMRDTPCLLIYPFLARGLGWLVQRKQ